MANEKNESLDVLRALFDRRKVLDMPQLCVAATLLQILPLTTKNQDGHDRTRHDNQDDEVF
jgi:hypothetical protein